MEMADQAGDGKLWVYCSSIASFSPSLISIFGCMWDKRQCEIQDWWTKAKAEGTWGREWGSGGVYPVRRWGGGAIWASESVRNYSRSQDTAAVEGRWERKGHRWRAVSRRSDRRSCLCLVTCRSDGLLVLVFVTLVKVVQIADICWFDAHQTGQALHVFITVGWTSLSPASLSAYNMIMWLWNASLTWPSPHG